MFYKYLLSFEYYALFYHALIGRSRVRDYLYSTITTIHSSSTTFLTTFCQTSLPRSLSDYMIVILVRCLVTLIICFCETHVVQEKKILLSPTSTFFHLRIRVLLLFRFVYASSKLLSLYAYSILTLFTFLVYYLHLLRYGLP